MNYNKNDFDFCRSYMIADERIIWKGKPDTKVRFSSDLHTLVFGIFWLGFSLFWCSGVYASGGGMMAFLGLPFVAVGIYLVLGKPIHSAIKRKNTAYVITNMKIIRACGNKIDTMDGRDLPRLNIKGFSDGMGTIHFGEQIVYRKNNRTYNGYSGGDFCLEAVPIKEVQIAINEMIQANNPNLTAE